MLSGLLSLADTLDCKPNDHAIVVLPFINAGVSPPDHYLADGLTQDLTDRLAATSTLRVIARPSASSFSANNPNLKNLSGQLGVGLMLTGRLDRSNSRSMVEAELRRVPSGERLWSHTYQVEGQNFEQVSPQIASAVAATLSAERTLPSRPAASPVNEQAYDLTLRAAHDMQQFTQSSYDLAEQELTHAIEIDPHYARAYFLLGQVYWNSSNIRGNSVRTQSEMKASAALWRKALEISPEFSAARAMLAKLDLQYQWDWTQAERELKNASAFASDYAAEDAYSFLLEYEGRFEEAIVHRRRAEELNPASVESRVNSTLFWFQMGNFKRSKEACDELKGPACFTMTAIANLALGRNDLVAGALKNADPHNPVNPFIQAMLAASEGDRDAALRIIRPLEASYPNLNAPVQWFALVYARMNDAANTVKWLNRSADAHEWQVLNMGVHPFYQGMHHDPAFQALERRIGLKR